MSELRSTQQCPICGAEQPRSARKCSICGAVLPGELTPLVLPPPVEEKPKRGMRPRYDPAIGEDDLFVGDLTGRMWRLVLVAGIGLALLLGLGLGLLVARWSDEDNPGPRTEAINDPNHATAPPTATLRRCRYAGFGSVCDHRGPT